MRKEIYLAVLLLLSAGAAVGQAQESKASAKPAWKWTLEERLAARFDPEAMKARAAETRRRYDVAEKAFRGPGRAQVTLPLYPSEFEVQGDYNPELFIPYELFDFLLYTCFPAEGVAQNYSRRRVEQRAAALGVGSDLWTRLRKSAKPLLDLDRQHFERAMEARRKGKDMPEEENGNLRCRLRAEALEAAKAQLGEETLLRLLYEAVAPGLASSGATNAEDARYQAGGCR
jgi:hypothetical protein